MLFGTLSDIIYIQFRSLRWQPEAVTCHDGKIAFALPYIPCLTCRCRETKQADTKGEQDNIGHQVRVPWCSSRSLIAKVSVGLGQWLCYVVARKDLKVNSRITKLSLAALKQDQDLVRSQEGNFHFFQLSRWCMRKNLSTWHWFNITQLCSNWNFFL